MSDNLNNELRIKENFLKIVESIDSLKSRLHIEHEVKIMGVTKTFDESYVLAGVKAGITLFGENRVLEAYGKYKSEILKNEKIELHIIGHLQRNKAREAVAIASAIDSIDKIETLEAIQREAEKQNKNIDFLIEVNTSNEPQKSGVSEDGLNNLLEQIFSKSLTKCNLRGVMTVGPLTDDEKKIRESFSSLKKIYDKLKGELKRDNFDTISMGMSGDYLLAIEEGSNLVRIGSSIFGKR